MPTWRFEVDGRIIEKTIVMPHNQNTVCVHYRLLDGPAIDRLNALGDRLRERVAAAGYEVNGSGSLFRIPAILGDFDAWQEQLLGGYARERDRLEREVDRAAAEVAEAERRRERSERAVGVAENEAQERAEIEG